jgi:hypothetical protein
LASCILLFGCGPAGSAPQAGGIRGSRQKVSVSNLTPAAPVLKHLAGDRFYVRKPWTVVLDGQSWVVPRGYSSNGITAPGLIKHSLGDGVDRPETWAAVFHDWLFTQPGMSRSRADGLFYDLLIAYGVSGAKARLMFTSVSAYSFTKKNR